MVHLYIFCLLQDPPDWTEILTNYRGSALQNFFKKILEDNLKAVIKPQYVDQIPRAVKVSLKIKLHRKLKIRVLEGADVVVMWSNVVEETGEPRENHRA